MSAPTFWMPSLVKPAARRDLVGLEAVVVAVAMRLVREAVELRADLTDLGEDDLLVAAALVRAGVHERALDVHVEAARAEERHRGPEHMRELDHLAGLDQLRGVEHGCGFMGWPSRARRPRPISRGSACFPAERSRMVSVRGRSRLETRARALAPNVRCIHRRLPQEGALKTAP